MGGRKKLNEIRNNFQRIFALSSDQARSPDMVELRQQALTRLSIWDGRFPGESKEDAVQIRQMDKASRQNNPHSLANYLRRLNCVGNEKDDWSCIFYAFKNYVYGNESAKDLELANKLFGGQVHEKEEEEEVSTQTSTEEQNDGGSGGPSINQENQSAMVEESEVIHTQDVQEGTESLPHRAPEKEEKLQSKEETKMADIREVEAILSQEAGQMNGVQEPNMQPATTTMNPTGAGTTTSRGQNMIDISSVGSAHMSGVSRVVDDEWASRQQWSDQRKIVKILCSGKPASHKLRDYSGPNSNIMGELNNTANKVLEAIAVALHSVDLNQREGASNKLKKVAPDNGVGYIFNEQTKEVVVPQCVISAGQAAIDDFKFVVETLVNAGETKPQFKVKITNSKPSITGVFVQTTDGKSEVYGITKLKDAMITNSKLDLEYSNYNQSDPTNKHSLLAAAAVSKVNAKKINDQSSYVKLVFGNRSLMFDKETGELTEYGAGIVDFVREITNEEDGNPRPVTSETGFQYKTAEGKMRTYALRVIAPTKAVKIVEAYQSIVSNGSSTNVVKPDSEAARQETIKLLNAITAKAPTSMIAQKVQGSALQGSADADAKLAAQAVGGAETFEN